MEYECELCRLVGQSAAIVYEDTNTLIIEKSKDQWLALSKEHIHPDENAQLTGEVLGMLMIQSFARTGQSEERAEFDLSLPYGFDDHYHVLVNFIEDYQDG